MPGFTWSFGCGKSDLRIVIDDALAHRSHRIKLHHLAGNGKVGNASKVIVALSPTFTFAASTSFKVTCAT